MTSFVMLWRGSVELSLRWSPLHNVLTHLKEHDDGH